MTALISALPFLGFAAVIIFAAAYWGTRMIHRCLRWLAVRALAVAIRHRPGQLLELRHGLERAMAHRGPVAAAEIWEEASRHAGIWPDG